MLFKACFCFVGGLTQKAYTHIACEAKRLFGLIGAAYGADGVEHGNSLQLLISFTYEAFSISFTPC